MLQFKQEFFLLFCIYLIFIAVPIYVFGKYGFSRQLSLSVKSVALETSPGGCSYAGIIYQKCYYLELELHDPSNSEHNHCRVVNPDETPHRSEADRWLSKYGIGNTTSDFLRHTTLPTERQCYTRNYVRQMELAGFVMMIVGAAGIVLPLVLYYLAEKRRRRLLLLTRAESSASSRHDDGLFSLRPDDLEQVIVDLTQIVV